MNTYLTQIKPRFRDTDAMGHVNNAVFLTYLELARSTWYNELKQKIDIPLNFILARVELDYRSQITLDHLLEIEMWVSRIGSKSWTFSYRMYRKDDPEIIHAQANTVQVYFDYDNNKTMPIPDALRSELQTVYRDESV